MSGCFRHRQTGWQPQRRPIGLVTPVEVGLDLSHDTVKPLGRFSRRISLNLCCFHLYIFLSFTTLFFYCKRKKHTREFVKLILYNFSVTTLNQSFYYKKDIKKYFQLFPILLKMNVPGPYHSNIYDSYFEISELTTTNLTMV